MVSFSVLGSGSCGNSYIFSCNGEAILVDAGYSYKQIEERIQNAGLDISTVKALLLTHLHPDHNKSAGTFARKTGNPVFVSEKCLQYASNEYISMNLPLQTKKFFEPGVPFQVGHFEINSFYTSHDSAGSVGYSIKCDEKTFVVITDTGFYTPQMVEVAKNANILFLESNYDEEMLRTGSYPNYLKKRIAGERGHLSNFQAQKFLKECSFDTNRKPVYLVPLSSNNNDPNLVALQMKDFDICVCKRGFQYCGEIQ